MVLEGYSLIPTFSSCSGGSKRKAAALHREALVFLFLIAVCRPTWKKPHAGCWMLCARGLLPLWRVERSLDLLPQMCYPWQSLLSHACCLGCSVQCTSFSSVASSSWEGRSPCMKLTTFSILLWALKKNSRPKGICCNRSWMSWDPWTPHLPQICRATGSHSLPGWV